MLISPSLARALAELFAILAPLILLSASLSSAARPLFRAARAAQLAAGSSLAAALAFALSALLAPSAPSAPSGALALSSPMARLDSPAVAMLVLVTALGAGIARFSLRYLDRSPHALGYSAWTLRALCAASTVVLSNHLALTVAAWIAASLSLHQLLSLDRARAAAQRAAHSKFIVSRSADVLLVLALFCIGYAARTLHIDALRAIASRPAPLSPLMHLGVLLLALGVVLKSAQLPAHGWLSRVMEAPTPISALLHAGVVNIGAYVLLTLAPLVDRSTVARAALLTAGVTTAVVGALVMVTQSNIKAQLAWSTIAQMGFLLAQCACGAWSFALLHLVAHSLYKAHAFLSASGVVDRATTLRRHRAPSATALALSAAGIAAAAIGPIRWAGSAPIEATASAIVLGLSFAPMLASGLSSSRVAAVGALVATAGLLAGWIGAHQLIDAPWTGLHAQRPLAAAVALLVTAALFAAQLATRRAPALADRVERLAAALHQLDERWTAWCFARWPAPSASQRSDSPDRARAEIEQEVSSS